MNKKAMQLAMNSLVKILLALAFLVMGLFLIKKIGGMIFLY